VSAFHTRAIALADSFQALPFVSVRSLASRLARVINHIHDNQSMSEWFREPSKPAESEKDNG
jgi:hypothetical protein